MQGAYIYVIGTTNVHHANQEIYHRKWGDGENFVEIYAYWHFHKAQNFELLVFVEIYVPWYFGQSYGSL